MLCPFCSAENEPGADTCFSCGRSLFSLTRGTVLSDRYEILATLGRGGMGMVYKAHDRELDETVAIKLLRADTAASTDAAKRFRNEIRLARRVRHRNVCAIHEYGQQAHLRYIVMEYVEGTDYKQILRAGGPLPAAEACTVAAQVADALQAIHEAGIVHRDLKTPNIMRDVKGVVRLMDFGIAKQLLGDTSTGTATGLIVGTPEYMSPEQARGEKVDARCDIYALGIVLHELLTGDVPLRGDTPLGTLLKHLSEPPRLQSPPLPGLLVPVLRKALAKDREERYQSAEELSTTLRDVRKELGSVPSPAHALPGRPPPTLRAVATQPLGGAEPDVATTPMPTPVPTSVPPPVPSPPPARPRRMEAPPPTMPAPPVVRSARAPASAASRRPRPVVFAVASLALMAVVVPGLLWRAAHRSAPPAPETGSSARTSSSVTPPESIAASTRSTAAVTRSAEPRREDADPVAAEPVAATPVAAEAPALAVRAPRPPVAPRPTTAAWRTPPEIPATTPPPASPPRMTGAPAPAPAATQPPATSPPAAATTAVVDVVAPPVQPAEGTLRIGVRPYAEVYVDGRPVGSTPMRPLRLPPGSYVVRLSHPDYQPLMRKVTIRAGEQRTLEVDLTLDGIRK